MKKITVVSPSYNEEENVRICYETVKRLFETELPGYEREHIFADNALLMRPLQFFGRLRQRTRMQRSS